jgi:phosphoglucosamine mutase
LKRFFGTDGIRGAAGEPPLDAETISKIGTALTSTLRRGDAAPRIFIGRDTRESGEWIESTLARSITGAGGVVAAAGIVTTAGVAFLTRTGGYDAGVMISASHNPFHDNGIKIFSADGFKLPDTLESRLEDLILSDSPSGETDFSSEGAAGKIGSTEERTGLQAPYIKQLVDAAGSDGLSGMKVVLDCANGAASESAPQVFGQLDARVEVLAATPDGRNINEACGSLHPESLSRKVVEWGAHVGFAFDGDADRCIAVDDKGNICDGDFIMYRAALAMKQEGSLGPDIVVGTVMSNLWLEKSLYANGIKLLRAPVGDKYVLEEMTRTKARIGGEQSGHVIFRENATTGDGILTAVMLAKILKRSGAKLSAWKSEIKPCPQILLNVRIASRPKFESHPEISRASNRVREKLGASGRLLLRYSGTEPLARVMIEGDDGVLIEELAGELAGVIQNEIGER